MDRLATVAASALVAEADDVGTIHSLAGHHCRSGEGEEVHC